MGCKTIVSISFVCYLLTSCWNPICKLKEEGITPAIVNAHIFQYYDQSFTTSNYLFGVSFPVASTGYVVGSSGSIYKTTDSAYTFTTLTSPTTSNLFDVYFVDTLNGFITGNDAFFQTNDGGDTWNTMNVPMSGMGYRKIGYRSSALIYLFGGDLTTKAVMYKSTDGGVTWDDIYWSGMHGISNMDFISDDTALTCGFYGEVMRTNDRGTTWSIMTVNTGVTSGAPVSLTDIKMLNSKVGFLIGYTSTGNDQLVLKTVDGGFNWNLINTGLTVTFNDIYTDLNILSANEIVISGGNQSTDIGLVIRSKDGGVTWAYDTIPSVLTIHRATVVNTIEYFVGSLGTVLKRF